VADRVDEITPELQRFLENSPVFFVATAPLASSGHVNLSPKGHDTFRVLNSRRVAYLDMTGSGNETAAHVTENSRLTIMACSFSGRPQIVRLYCRGRVVSRNSPEGVELLTRFPNQFGTRQIIVGDVEFLNTSCGYAVPEMTLLGARETLRNWAASKGEDGLATYRRKKNRESIDGVPAPPTDEE
jgi:hypothetical protein